MSIANESRLRTTYGDVASDIVLLSGVTNNLKLFRFVSPATVLRIGILVTTAPTVTVPVVAFDRRVTIGSDTGRISQGVGNLTFPAVASAPVGTIVYKEVESDVNAGDEISVNCTTAASAGAGIPFLEYVNRHEAAANQAKMVAGS